MQHPSGPGLPEQLLHAEKELLLKVAGGDMQAFAELVRKHWQNVYVHVFTYLKRAERAEEVTQDIFLDCWKQRTKLSEIENFPNYLFRITRNSTIDALRKKLEILDKYTDIEAVAHEAFYLPPSSFDLKDVNDLILQAIDLLPPRRRAIFKLSRLEGRSQAEIAAELDISINTVNVQITSALQFLRAHLSSQRKDLFTMIMLAVILS